MFLFMHENIARTLIDVGDNVTFDDLFDNDSTESSIPPQ